MTRLIFLNRRSSWTRTSDNVILTYDRKSIVQVFENLRQAGALEGIEDAPPGGFTPAMLPALYRRSTQRQGQKQHTTLAQLAAGQRELLEGQAELKQIVVSNCFS